MKKYIAKQIPPEFQESPLMLEGDNWQGTWLEGLCFWGNPDYKGHKTPELEALLDKLENLADDYEGIEQDGYSAYETFPEAVKGYFPDYKGEDWKAWEELCEAFLDAEWEFTESVICKGLALLTGKKYHYKQISGCCQGEWQIVYYPADEWDDDSLAMIEAQYFNTGEEWIVSEELLDENTSPEDIEGVSYYTIGWNDEQTRQELGNAMGCKPEDIIMYRSERITVTSHVRV